MSLARAATAASTRPRAAVTLLLATLACTPTGSLGKDLLPDASTSTSAATSSDGSVAAESTGSSTDSTPATDTSTDSSSESSTGLHASSSSDTTESTGMPICPPAGDDDACETCTKGHCCDELTACDADPTCTCIHACHAGGTALPECEVTCGTDTGENAALEQCMHGMCMAPCA
jgi:hypothetical protein